MLNKYDWYLSKQMAPVSITYISVQELMCKNMSSILSSIQRSKQTLYTNLRISIWINWKRNFLVFRMNWTLNRASIFKAGRSVCLCVHVCIVHQTLDIDALCLFGSVHVETRHCVQLHLDNFNTYTPAHTHTSWHTYRLLCTKLAYARWNTHAKLLWTFPSNVYASAAIKEANCYVGSFTMFCHCMWAENM